MVKLVLLLIDGLGYTFLQPDRAPFWEKHSTEICNVEPTITVPNWASILSGLSPKKHGITENKQVSYLRGKRYGPKGKPLKTLCDDFKTVFISDWNPMRAFTSGPFYFTKHVFEDFPHLFHQHPEAELFILNADKIDSLAHVKGWGSPAYHRVMKLIDEKTYQLYQLLLQQKGPFLLLGMADHGGFRKNHEAVHHESVRQVPFLFVHNMSLKRPRIQTTRGLRPWLRRHKKCLSLSKKKN